MACASLLLMLRGIALWERRRVVVVPLVLLHLGQWGTLSSFRGTHNTDSPTLIGLYLHNVFIVIPQFIITGISSIIFAIAGARESPELPQPSGNSTLPELLAREGPGPSGGGPNSYAYVFRYVLSIL